MSDAVILAAVAVWTALTFGFSRREHRRVGELVDAVARERRRLEGDDAEIVRLRGLVDTRLERLEGRVRAVGQRSRRLESELLAENERLESALRQLAAGEFSSAPAAARFARETLEEQPS